MLPHRLQLYGFVGYAAVLIVVSVVGWRLEKRAQIRHKARVHALGQLAGATVVIAAVLLEFPLNATTGVFILGVFGILYWNVITVRHCPGCGRRVRPKQPFCANCGRALRISDRDG
jgi:rRNA maturation endonuclease Nob1